MARVMWLIHNLFDGPTASQTRLADAILGGVRGSKYDVHRWIHKLLTSVTRVGSERITEVCNFLIQRYTFDFGGLRLANPSFANAKFGCPKFSDFAGAEMIQ